MTDAVLGVVRGVIAEVASGEQVSDDTPLITERIIDSLSLLRIVATLESQLGVRIDDTELLPKNFDSILSIRAFLTTKGV